MNELLCPQCGLTWPDDYDASCCDCGYEIDSMEAVTPAMISRLPQTWQKCPPIVRMLLAAIDRGGQEFRACERCGLVYVGFDGSRHCLPCCRPDVFTTINHDNGANDGKSTD